MVEQIKYMLNEYLTLDLLTVGVSLLLLIAATPISRLLNDDEGLNARVSMMRVLNFLVIAASLSNAYLLSNNAWLPKITQALMVIYFAMLFTQIINYFIRQRFGKVRVLKDKINISDTYSSRGLSIFIAVITTIIALVSCLRILGFDSILEAGGALGIIGLFLAMTQAAWAPDIISGLIILNSRLCEEGDVIQVTLDGERIVASIFRTKLFHTECLDISNNHRMMIRNAKLRDQGLQNLSRFASAKGLRESLLLNIDYKHTEDEVCRMILRAFDSMDKSEGVREEQYEPEIFVHDTGDYAVTWAVFYYIKDVKRLITIKNIVRSYILKESQNSNISLSTPILQNNTVEVSQLNSPKADIEILKSPRQLAEEVKNQTKEIKEQ